MYGRISVSGQSNAGNACACQPGTHPGFGKTCGKAQAKYQHTVPVPDLAVILRICFLCVPDCSINKQFVTAICISHATFKEAGERLWIRPVDVITVKGRKGETSIYELVAIRGHDAETMVTPQVRHARPGHAASRRPN